MDIIMPYLLTLGNRNDPIYVVLPKVTKTSDAMCHCRWRFR